MRTLGLIGGMSWESTAVYYRLLNEGVRERLGGLHSAKLLLWSADFAEIAALQTAGDWTGAAGSLADAARALERGGADALLIATNTMHKVADAVAASVGVPLIHIADATGAAISAAGCARPALLGTRFTMEQDFYVGRLRERHGLDVRVPDEAGRALVHRVIYDELCRGVTDPVSKLDYLRVTDALVAEGADCVIFGCTEVGLLLAPEDLPVPAFDTTRLHVEAGLAFALGG
jgi:aspartate racemase